MNDECPVCHDPLKVRTNSQNKRQFWGCSNYPYCQYTAPLNFHKKRKLEPDIRFNHHPDYEDPFANPYGAT